MYGKKRRSKWPATELTPERREDLLDNWHGLVGGPDDAFKTEAERKACWKAHRAKLMYVSSGYRPSAWWNYEAPVRRDLCRCDSEQLYRLGELSPTEREEFEAWWTKHGHSLDEVPPADFMAPDPRTLPSE